MRRVGMGLLAGLMFALTPAGALHAAEATDVLDALDTDNVFDANLELSYVGHGKTAKITREDVRKGKSNDVVEFLYVEHSHQVVPRIRVGLFQDIEIFMSLPYTVWEQRLGWYHYRNGFQTKKPSEQGYSTFVRDECLYSNPEKRPKECSPDWETTEHRDTLSGNPGSWPVNHEYDVDANGHPVGGEPNNHDTNWDFNLKRASPYEPVFNSVRGFASYRVSGGLAFFPKGIGDAELGFAFSPFSIARFNDQRDNSMPTMRVEVKYQLPSGWLDSPTSNEKLWGTADNFDPGGIGTGLHRVTLSMNMSKRLKLFDPYIGGHYTLGIPQQYPAEKYAGENKYYPERNWTDLNFWQNKLGINAGVEVIPLYSVEEIEGLVNLRAILGGRLNYIAGHRGPSEMSDVLNKWTHVDNYVEVLGNVGLLLSVPFVTLKATLEYGHETAHLLTGESAGTDKTGNGIDKKEVNPFYNPLLDSPGRRVKVSESQVFNGMFTLAICF